MTEVNISESTRHPSKSESKVWFANEASSSGKSNEPPIPLDQDFIDVSVLFLFSCHGGIIFNSSNNISDCMLFISLMQFAKCVCHFIHLIKRKNFYEVGNPI